MLYIKLFLFMNNIIINKNKPNGERKKYLKIFCVFSLPQRHSIQMINKLKRIFNNGKIHKLKVYSSLYLSILCMVYYLFTSISSRIIENWQFRKERICIYVCTWLGDKILFPKFTIQTFMVYKRARSL